MKTFDGQLGPIALASFIRVLDTLDILGKRELPMLPI